MAGQNTAEDISHDPFEEEGSTSTKEADAGKAEEVDKGAPTKEGDDAEGETNTGEEDAASGTPPEADDKGEEGAAKGKMIPEHQFKAALKNVTEERDALRREADSRKTIEVPDREADPDGYDLHVRMSTSRRMMRDLVPDYDEVVQHYNEMAEANPMLNNAVAAAPAPAKFAYDLAKKDLEMQELSNFKQSDEYKAFTAWKKAAGKTDKTSTDVAQKLTEGTTKVPNLNRNTNVKSLSSAKAADDDELFEGKL